MARNILVVEDDRNISDLIRMYMEKEGFEVRSAYDGGKAIEEFEKQAPDLVLLDDLENDENVRSPEQRDKLENWLMRTVLSLGPADDSMDVIYIGTILHYDSVLARTLKKPQWHGRTFRAVEKMPDDLALWDIWERFYKTPSVGPEKARAFYEQHRQRMDAGAVVSWPDFRPLLTANSRTTPWWGMPRPSRRPCSSGVSCRRA